jgi:hypothetical protein
MKESEIKRNEKLSFKLKRIKSCGLCWKSKETNWENVFVSAACLLLMFIVAECFKAWRSCENKTDDNQNNSQNISQFVVSFHKTQTRKMKCSAFISRWFKKIKLWQEKKFKEIRSFFWWKLTEWVRKTWKVLWQFVTDDDA